MLFDLIWSYTKFKNAQREFLNLAVSVTASAKVALSRRLNINCSILAIRCVINHFKYRVVQKLSTPLKGGVLNIAYNPMMASMLQQSTPKGGT